MTITEPGIYENLSAAEYHAIDACSNSRLTKLYRSPAHLRAYIEEPKESTPAQIIGSAADVLTLEPHVWDERFAVAGRCAAQTKNATQCANDGSYLLNGEWFCGVKSHAPEGARKPLLTIVTENDYAKCKRMADSVRSHPRFSKLLGSPGRAQLTIVWNDPDTGMLCKGRIDWLADQIGAAMDLKTATDAREHAFQKSIAEYGYHRQLAFYRDGLGFHGIQLKHLVFAVVEKEAPFAVAGYRLSEGATSEGAFELDMLKERYAELLKIPMADWPAYNNDITEISLPTWAYGRVKGLAA